MRSLVLLLAASSLAAGAADLNGIWLGYMLNKNGDKVDVSMKLTQTGGKVGGKLYGDYKSNPVVEGVVNGDEVDFVVLASEQAGNQINDSRLRFKGKFVSENELELTRQRESTRNIGNSGNSATTEKPAPSQLVKMKRLL